MPSRVVMGFFYAGVVLHKGDGSGSVWESNPLGAFFKPPTGFEDQGPHQRCKHSRTVRPPSFSRTGADCSRADRHPAVVPTPGPMVHPAAAGRPPPRPGPAVKIDRRPRLTYTFTVSESIHPLCLALRYGSGAPPPETEGGTTSPVRRRARTSPRPLCGL